MSRRVTEPHRCSSGVGSHAERVMTHAFEYTVTLAHAPARQATIAASGALRPSSSRRYTSGHVRGAFTAPAPRRAAI